MVIVDSISETRYKLKSWDKGQTESEGLAAIVLSCSGYEQVDPITCDEEVWKRALKAADKVVDQ